MRTKPLFSEERPRMLRWTTSDTSWTRRETHGAHSSPRYRMQREAATRGGPGRIFFFFYSSSTLVIWVIWHTVAERVCPATFSRATLRSECTTTRPLEPSTGRAGTEASVAQCPLCAAAVLHRTFQDCSRTDSWVMMDEWPYTSSSGGRRMQHRIRELNSALNRSCGEKTKTAVKADGAAVTHWTFICIPVWRNGTARSRKGKELYTRLQERLLCAVVLSDASAA